MIVSVVQKCKHVNPNHPVLAYQESPILKIPVHGTTSQSFGEKILPCGKKKDCLFRGLHQCLCI